MTWCCFAGRVSARDDPTHLMNRALAYPGTVPGGSFALDRRGVVSLGVPDTLDTATIGAAAGRTALLAYGSNAAPEVLRHKLGPDAEIVGLGAEMPDSDVVYSAHVAAYGAVPGTLWPSPGSELSCHVLLLGRAELSALDATEPNYERRLLSGAPPTLASLPAPWPVWAYHSRHGALRIDVSAMAVAPVRTSRRRLASLGQAEVLARVRDRLDPGRPLADFVTRAVVDAELRAIWTARLRADALWPPGPPR